MTRASFRNILRPSYSRLNGTRRRRRSARSSPMARAAAACSWPRLAAPRALPRLGAAAPRQLVHGTEHHDEFAWLSDERSEAVAAQLEAEERYTHAHLQPLVAAQMRLYNAMASGLAAAAELRQLEQLSASAGSRRAAGCGGGRGLRRPRSTQAAAP